MVSDLSGLQRTSQSPSLYLGGHVSSRAQAGLSLCLLPGMLDYPPGREKQTNQDIT